jgi:hypothetical protein
MVFDCLIKILIWKQIEFIGLNAKESIELCIEKY